MRRFKSGARKKRERVEAQQRRLAVTSSCAPLTKYFGQATTAPGAAPDGNETDECGHTHILKL